MTTALTRKYNPHTRAVRMAASTIQQVTQSFAKDAQGAPFMGVRRSPGRQAIHEDIAASPLAMEMIRRGYPMSVAHEVSKMEKEGKG